MTEYKATEVLLIDTETESMNPIQINDKHFQCMLESDEISISLNSDYATRMLCLALSNPNIKTSELSLYTSKMSLQNFTDILDVLTRTNTSVVNLSLSETDLDLERCGMLTEALKTNKNIKFIDLSANMINDTGCMMIQSLIEANNTIKTLDLSYNDFGYQGCVALMNAAMKNQTLTKIDLSGNDITDAGCQKLVETLLVRNTLKIEFNGDHITPIIYDRTRFY